MKDESQNELLSAYLDGELTAEERARVEQLLAASVEARQLLDELRALSATLKSLPRKKLGVDLSEDVLRIGKRRMLTEPADEKTETMGSDALQEPAPIFSLRRLKNPRIWVWQIAIVAAVLLLLVYNPDRNVPPAGKAERNIAMAPKPEEKGTSVEPPSIQAARSFVVEDQKEKSAALSESEGTIETSRESGIAQADKQAVAHDMPTTSGGMAPGVAPAALGANDMPTAGVGMAPDTQQPEAPDALAKPVAPDASPVREQFADEEKSQAESTDELLVVRCDITPEAQKNRAFDKLLTSNSIAWSEGEKDNISEQYVPNYDTIQSLLDIKTDQTTIKTEGEDRSKAARDRIEVFKAGPLEIVYVEAPPAQIEATLNGLSAQNDTYKNVSVAQSKDSSQLQPIAAYENRPRGIAGAFRGAQAKVVQSKAAAEPRYQMSPRRDTLGRASPNINNAVQGRAQRIPFPMGYDVRAAAPMSPAPSGVLSGAAVPSQGFKQAEAAQKSRNAQETDSQYGGARMAPSGSTESPVMQRVLFVLQVVEPNNYSESSKQSAASDAAPDRSAPAEASPAKQ